MKKRDDGERRACVMDNGGISGHAVISIYMFM